MKFLKWLILFILFMAFVYSLSGGPTYTKTVVVLALVAWVTFSTIISRHKKSKSPGGLRGSVLQGIWVLEKHFRFDPVLRKYEVVSVEPKKNYFEFKGSNFRSGDFDEDRRQLPAEFSPFSVIGDNLVIETEFFKRANWKWSVKGTQLELIGEMAEPKDSKSQFIFYKKNWY